MIWNFEESDQEPEKKQEASTPSKRSKDVVLDLGHTAVIQDIIVMSKLQFIASAALDGAIILWDMISYKKKRVYKEHQRGILSLAFNESNILLFSAGFDHWVTAYSFLSNMAEFDG